METKSAQPERLRAVTLIFRFPAGLGTLRIRAGCRASSGLFPQPLLISCYSVVVKLVYHRFLAKSTIFRCAVQTVCTKVGQMRQRVWFWRRVFPIGGEGGRGPARGRMRAKLSLPPIDEWLRQPGPHQSPSVTASPCAGEAFLTFSRAARRTAACKSGSRAPRPADL